MSDNQERIYRIVYPDTSILFNYDNADDSIRKKFLIDSNQGRCSIYCNCHKNKKLEYKFNIRGNLYPTKKFMIHNKECPNYKNMENITIYIPGFLTETENKSAVANYVEESKKQYGDDKKTKRTGIHQNNNQVVHGQLTMRATMAHINQFAFFRAALITEDKYKNFAEFQAFVFSQFKKVYLGRTRKTLSEFQGKYSNGSFNKDSILFMYGELKTIDSDRLTYIRRHYGSELAIVEKEYYCLFMNEEQRDKILREFERTYKTTVENIKEKGYRIICAGTLSDKKGPYKCVDVCLMLVSRYGLYCESMKEADFFDYIIDYINRKKGKNQAFFYRPYDRISSLYENDFVEDGIISFRDEREDIVVECFGMDNDDYNKRKNEKLSYKIPMIHWDASQNKEMPELSFLN